MSPWTAAQQACVPVASPRRGETTAREGPHLPVVAQALELSVAADPHSSSRPHDLGRLRRRLREDMLVLVEPLEATRLRVLVDLGNEAPGPPRLLLGWFRFAPEDPAFSSGATTPRRGTRT